jgi:hypothetical protein
MYEAASLSCNVAFWYMKHASMVAAKDKYVSFSFINVLFAH